MSAWFADPSNLAMGAAAGFVFGFLLQKGGVTRYSVIVNQFRMVDFTVLKVMLTAVVVGGLGIYTMNAMGMEIPMHIKATAVVANALGGMIFGVGMALLGYCPGTAIAAIGEGSRHAIVGVLGMLVGAAVYAELYPWLNDRILKVADLGKVTLATQTHIPALIILVALGAAGAVVFRLLPDSSREPAAS